jgi:polyisoprenoid-binding protein YceI
MAGRARTFVLAALAVVLVAGGALWWFVLRDDAPEEAKLDTKSDCAVQGGAATPNGSWEVKPGKVEEGFVGYRMQELFGGETIKKTAVGRTPDVTGSMTVAGTSISDVTIEADMTTLASDRTARDTKMTTDGLETNDFPDATFTATGPVALPAAAAKGTAVKATVDGELELHGEKKAVEVPVQACWTGATIRVTGSAPVVLADYGIDQVETPIVEMDDHGSFEFELTFVPA